MITLQERLESLAQRPTVAEYQALARALPEYGDALKPLNVAVLASFTIDPLLPFFRVEAARHGFAVNVYVGPFNTVRQELLHSASGCVRHNPDIVFVTELLEDVCAPLVDDYLALSSDRIDHLIEDGLATMMTAIGEFRSRSNAPVVVSNFPVPAEPLLGIFEPMAERSQTEAVRRANERLATCARRLAGVYVQDIDRLIAETGAGRWFDRKMWYLARAPLSAHALPALAASMALFLRAAFGPPRKCLVVDLDNTLWGGVLGEQGVEGIQVGFTYPGNVYRRFQQTLLSLRRRGVLLAIASKNNPEEVEEVFRTHPDMVLREQHFSAARVNWRDKPENVLEIAAELNIAPSSLVFFDDSPVECARMRDALPEVLTVQAPRDVLDYLGALRRSGAFERLTFTAEDQQRAEMYHQERERKQMQKGAATVEEFLTGLEMGAEIRPIDTFTLPRAVELTQKTNQFNLTTRRYTAPELARAIESPGGAGFCLRLWDRFGDHGIVGLAILQIDGDAARIDTFLLSCRVIGRSAETALLAFIVRWARARGVSTIEGTFVPTARNAPAADFYARHGFSASTAADGSTAWRLPASSDVAWPPAIRAVDGLAEPA